MNRNATAALALLLGCACISTNQVVRPGGDAAKITMKNRTCCNAEILAVTQTDLYFVLDRHVWRSPLVNVTSVRVQGYDLKTAKYVTLGVLGAADVTLCAYSAAQGCWPYAAVFAALGAAGAWFSLSAEPRVGFRPPLADNARAQLALYCRYPQGLTDAQWQELLRFYQQDTFLSPGDLPRP